MRAISKTWRRALIYTNIRNLPAAFVRAVVNDPYSKGKSDFSATGLANPPRATALVKLFADKVTTDVSSKVASIIGQGAHSVAERAARPGIDLCEDRLFATFPVDGVDYIISGQLDLYETDTGKLYDWKTAKAYAFSKKNGSGKKPEWTAQLNVGAELLRRNEHSPKSLHIIALLKDWVFGSKDPDAEVIEVNLTMWAPKKTVEYIEKRIRAHVAAKQVLPLCTRSDTWNGGRCARWCDASSVCEQYQNSLKTGLMEYPQKASTE